MPKKERVKRTRAKAKNVIQKVVVNVGGRGGGGRKTTAPSGPPRPTPLQQATQFLQATQSRPQQAEGLRGESMIQSAQMLQRLLEPVNVRLEALMQQRQGVQPINMPPINISNPINIQQPDIFVAPPNISINQRFPDINIQHRDHNRQHVADLPDEPLVRPNAPLLLAGPMRMDDPHEDVPLNKVDPALVLGKQEAKGSQDESRPFGKQEEVPIEIAMKEIEEEQERKPVSASASASDRFQSISLTPLALDKLPLRRKANTPPTTITLTELASYYSLPLPREILDGGKQLVIKYLIQEKGR